MTHAESRPLLELLRYPAEPAPVATPSTSHTLHTHSGRTVSLHEGARGGEDYLHVSSPEGKVELTIRFSAEGPVLSFDALQLDLKSTGSVNLDCERLTLRGRQGVELRSDAELSVRSQEDMRIDGKNVLINCDRPYHVPPASAHAHSPSEDPASCCEEPALSPSPSPSPTSS